MHEDDEEKAGEKPRAANDLSDAKLTVGDEIGLDAGDEIIESDETAVNAPAVDRNSG